MARDEEWDQRSNRASEELYGSGRIAARLDELQYPITGARLAEELEHEDEGRAVRVVLRREFPPGPGKGNEWAVTREMAGAVLAHFKSRP